MSLRKKKARTRCPKCGNGTARKETEVRAATTTVVWRCASCDAVWHRSTTSR